MRDQISYRTNMNTGSKPLGLNRIQPLDGWLLSLFCNYVIINYVKVLYFLKTPTSSVLQF